MNYTTKICTKCKLYKSLEDFNKVALSLDGLSYDCKSCVKERSDKWFKENKNRKLSLNRKWKDTHKAEARLVDWISHIKREYGLTLVQYNDLLQKQDNRCAICGGLNPGGKRKYFSVDHDHLTGKVRGLLCDPCNNLLGRAKDNIQILKSAISYLESFSNVGTATA